MSLSIYEILTINAVLAPALVALWMFYLNKEFSRSIARLRSALKSYEREKAKDLLKLIREAEKERDEEEAMEKISENTDRWIYTTEATSFLYSKESRIHKYGKYVIVLFAAIFLFGIYASQDPLAIFIGELTRIDAFYGFFALEIGVIFYWIWPFFDFSRILSRATDGQTEELEKVIEETIEEVKREEEGEKWNL